MNTPNIYELKNKLTLCAVTAIVKEWEADDHLNSLALYHRLVSLGDSPEMACATALCLGENEESDFYSFAYES